MFRPQQSNFLMEQLDVYKRQALEGAASYLMFRYMEEVCSFSGVAGRMIKYMGKVPFFFFEIMLLATPWMGFFFYFKDGSYYQGNFAWFGYVYIGYYFFMNLLLIFLGRARIETRIKVIVILYLSLIHI